jgi:hypothetical protein
MTPNSAIQTIVHHNLTQSTHSYPSYFSSIPITRTSLGKDFTRIWVTCWASARPVTLQWRMWTPQCSISVAEETPPSIFILIFNVLTFYNAMVFVDWKLCASVFYTRTLEQFGGPACDNIRIPWWWQPGSAETREKNTMLYCVWFFVKKCLVGRANSA